MSKKNRLMMYKKLVAEGRLEDISKPLKEEFGDPKPFKVKK